MSSIPSPDPRGNPSSQALPSSSARPHRLKRILKGIALNSCPQCSDGWVCEGFYGIQEACSRCGYCFSKEPGYFLGSLIAAYFLCAFSLVPTLLFLVFGLQWDPFAVVTTCTLQLAVLHPLLCRYSRLIWLYVEGELTETFEKETLRSQNSAKKM
jgi:uncharacterized protein (DUF983 family)